MAPPFKRRKVEKADHPEELKFDPAARSEYLTGFHKRKEARKEAARVAAIQRDKDEKVRERKQLREQRNEDLEKHVAAINDELRKQNAFLEGKFDKSEEDDGASQELEQTSMAEAELEPLPSDEEYVDEERYTTVTVEAMGESDDEGDAAANKAKLSSVAASNDNDTNIGKKNPRAKDGESKAKVKKKKFRYETKAERTLTRRKQKSKNRVAAKARRTG